MPIQIRQSTSAETPAEHADAWMVQALEPGLIGPVRGQVRCADALGDPRHWQE
ncbi:hypothetical protein [Thiobaca trueperi]|uniref:hypothetical protein n=1 Tax=Thiobaca trueperi TaxID=127458 RepID=UPI001A9DE6E3|nr:hypothetical protein [Thiobaca trueperi]